MAIVTRSGWTLDKDVFDLGKNRNERESGEQVNEKRKQLDKSNDIVTKTTKPIVKNLKINEERLKVTKLHKRLMILFQT